MYPIYRVITRARVGSSALERLRGLPKRLLHSFCGVQYSICLLLHDVAEGEDLLHEIRLISGDSWVASPSEERNVARPQELAGKILSSEVRDD